MRFKFSTLMIWALVAIGSGAIIWQAQTRSVQSVVVPVKVPPLSATAQRGQAVFEQDCKICHGMNAGGSVNGPPLVHLIYAPNHHADITFFMAVKLGVQAHHWTFGNMPPIRGVSEDKITQITMFVRELQKANGIN